MSVECHLQIIIHVHFIILLKRNYHEHYLTRKCWKNNEAQYLHRILKVGGNCQQREICEHIKNIGGVHTRAISHVFSAWKNERDILSKTFNFCACASNRSLFNIHKNKHKIPVTLPFCTDITRGRTSSNSCCVCLN